MKELGEHAQQQAQEARRLKQEVEERDEQHRGAGGAAERLESRLGGVSEERIALQRHVDAQERVRSERRDDRELVHARGGARRIVRARTS